MSATAIRRISIPNNWEPRKHQFALWQYMQSGGKRGVAVWHRRAGKDSLSINWTAAAAFSRVGVYWHMLPEGRQGRKVIWDGIDSQGRRIIDQAFPLELRTNTRNDEMRIELKNGSIWQVVGSDGYNSLVGANPVGVVFSEYSISKPSAWDYIRPILAENGGWAMFIFTPRGRNHGHKLYQIAKNNPAWFAEILTVADTGVLSAEAIADERSSGMEESMIEQEYYCSFEGALVGSYYGKLLNELDSKNQITQVNYDPAIPVHTFWDLGYSDDTAIWFAQVLKGEIHIIDYYAAHGQDVPHYAEALKSKPYKYAKWHWLPHDARAKTLSANGRSIEQQLNLLGFATRIAPELSVQDGIQAVRITLPRCWFDADKCNDGLEALRQYQREWSEDMRSFKDHPKHDWTSHSADAFRYLALAWREVIDPKPAPKPKYELEQTFNQLQIGRAHV